MMITEVLITNKCALFLQKKGLIPQWKKAKEYILTGKFSAISFKKRRPYKSEKYYFRLNRQYRAIGFIEDNTLKIFEVNDHQN